MAEKDFLRKYPYAVDKKDWAEMAKIDTCTVLVRKKNAF